MKPRVLFVQPAAGRYGSERSLLLLTQRLVARGWTIRVHVGEDGPLADDLRAAHIAAVRRDVGAMRRAASARGWILFALRLPGAILGTMRAGRQHDLVHVNSTVCIGGLVGARLSRRPVVLHARESYAGRGRAWRAYAKLLGAVCDKIIAVSPAIAEELGAAGLADKTVVIRNGIAFGAVEDNPPRGPDARILMIGRVNGWKGQDVLVRAVALLRERGVDVPVTIAGDSYPGQERYWDELTALVDELGVRDLVDLPGFVADVGRRLDEATIFVLPSVRPEPFGLALVDAMGRGLPSVASDAGGPQDIVRNGETGLLVPPGDPGALADAIGRLAVDPDLRDRLGRAGAEDVRRRFSIDRVADEVAAVHESLTSWHR